MASSTRRRTYRSPLRAEQMDRTRDKLIEAGIDIVTEEGDGELTVRAVAARAGVSVPTAYRHFADREVLLDAMALWINDRIGGGSIPTHAEGVAEWVRGVYANFAANDRLMRAQLKNPAGQQLRAKNQKLRKPKLLEMVKRSFPTASADAQRRVTALIQLLANVPAWVSLHDQWGMDGAEAGDVTTWAIQVLLAEIRRHPKALDFER